MKDTSIYAEPPRPQSPGLTREQAFKKDLLLQVTHEWRSSEALARTRAELFANRIEARKRLKADKVARNLRRSRMLVNRRKKQLAAIEKEKQRGKTLSKGARLAPGFVMKAVLVVSRAYNVSVMEMLGATRQHHVAEARCAAWHRAFVKAHQKGAPMTLPQIGRIVGRDHTTILYGIRRHCERHNLPCPDGIGEWRTEKTF